MRFEWAVHKSVDCRLIEESSNKNKRQLFFDSVRKDLTGSTSGVYFFLNPVLYLHHDSLHTMREIHWLFRNNPLDVPRYHLNVH